MIISLNWLKKYVDINIPTDELVELIGSRLVEVEEVIDFAPKYAQATIVKVVSAEKIKDSDHLNLCQVDDGGAIENVKRNDDGTVQVVCGSPNIRAGVMAVWLPPGAVVPETYGKDNQVRMEARKLRGHVSNGMLAGSDELDLSERTDDVVYIDPAMAKPGDSFLEMFGLDGEILLDIENKSLTHRPDCFGIIGFAREVAGILGQPFKNPEYFDKKVDFEITGKDAKLDIEITDPELCPRYSAVLIERNEKNKPYLTQAQIDLVLSGMRPIDFVVDWTNIMMLLTGQPLHAFDYDKLVRVGGLDKPKIIVRAAKNGEKMELLDGREIEMTTGDIVITSNNVPVALAGAMGGRNTEIDANTKRIIVESATFNLYNLRGTQFRHGIFSEAITRFTKGQPAELAEHVVREFVRRVAPQYKAVSGVFDSYPKKVENQPIEFPLMTVSKILGKLKGKSLDNYGGFDLDLVEKTLKNIGYKIDCHSGLDPESSKKVVAKSDTKSTWMLNQVQHDKLTVQAPWWRTDIHIPEDVIEDIGRINGYDNITPTLPTRDFAAVQPDPMIALKQKIREILASFGANEILSYSFVSEDLLKKVGQDSANSYKIVNSISPQLQYVRQQITPSLLEKSYQNLRAGYDEFALFEINQVFSKSAGLTDEKVPEIWHNMALVLTNKDSKPQFYDAKNYVVKLGEKLGVKFEFRDVTDVRNFANYFETKRSARIFVGGTSVGTCGEFRASVLKNLKLPNGTAGFEIGVDLLLDAMGGNPTARTNYQPIAKYPGTSRDLTFQISTTTTFADVENLVKEILENLPENFATKITPIDIFAPDENLKNITLRIDFTDREQTIDVKKVAEIIVEIAKTAAVKLDAKII